MIVYALTKSNVLRATDAVPDGPGQYVLRDVRTQRYSNHARAIGTLTIHGRTYDIVEYKA